MSPVEAAGNASVGNIEASGNPTLASPRAPTGPSMVIAVHPRIRKRHREREYDLETAIGARIRSLARNRIAAGAAFRRVQQLRKSTARIERIPL